MSNRRHRALVALLGATLALMTVLVPVGVAGSAKPVSMTITAFIDHFPFSGPFTATGDLICPSGTAEDIPDSFVGGGFPSGQVIEIQPTKLLTCDDGSGTILLASTFHIDLAGGETSTWHIEADHHRVGARERAGLLAGRHAPRVQASGGWHGDRFVRHRRGERRWIEPADHRHAAHHLLERLGVTPVGAGQSLGPDQHASLGRVAALRRDDRRRASRPGHWGGARRSAS